MQDVCVSVCVCVCVCSCVHVCAYRTRGICLIEGKLLPVRASEQDNVIWLVSIYISSKLFCNWVN